jgi:hypothetical protein
VAVQTKKTRAHSVARMRHRPALCLSVQLPCPLLYSIKPCKQHCLVSVLVPKVTESAMIYNAGWSLRNSRFSTPPVHVHVRAHARRRTSHP